MSSPPPAPVHSPWQALVHRFRHWRRAAKGAMPYVRRRMYRRAVAKYDALASVLCGNVPHAADAGITVVRPAPSGTADNLCLFLTYQPGPAPKPHVVAHVTALLDRGVRVVLIVNTALPAGQLQFDPAWVARLDGLYVRENTGFDFAGWAHVHGLVAPTLSARRLFLVNDSIIGPLNDHDFDRLLARVQAAKADVVGLTESMTPRPHLQSFFLVFNQRAIDEALGPFFRNVLSLPDKGMVIDVYETRWTQRLRQDGFVCEALFPPLIPHALESNDTHDLWQELIAAGFPYIKASVMASHPDHPEVRRLVTSRFRAA